MAYIKGSTHIWSDGEKLHLWCVSGLDNWQSMEAYEGNPNASGVQISEAVADEFSVMRFAELVKLGKVQEVVRRALAHGNFGGTALAELASVLEAVHVGKDDA
ncbi:hypothetical protein [Roseateles sp. P5_E7]